MMYFRGERTPPFVPPVAVSTPQPRNPGRRKTPMARRRAVHSPFDVGTGPSVPATATGSLSPLARAAPCFGAWPRHHTSPVSSPSRNRPPLALAGPGPWDPEDLLGETRLFLEPDDERGDGDEDDRDGPSRGIVAVERRAHQRPQREDECERGERAEEGAERARDPPLVAP